MSETKIPASFYDASTIPDMVKFKFPEDSSLNGLSFLVKRNCCNIKKGYIDVSLDDDTTIYLLKDEDDTFKETRWGDLKDEIDAYIFKSYLFVKEKEQ